MKFNPSFTVTVYFLLAACNQPNHSKPSSPTTTIKPAYEKIGNAQWLLGSWFNHSKDGNATEIWNKDNDSTYSAESFIVSGKDTVFHELVSLQQRNNEVHLIVKVKGDNDNQAVHFKNTSTGASPLVFENPSHDFPTKITYYRITQDSLYAEISGMIKGQHRKEGFPFKRK